MACLAERRVPYIGLEGKTEGDRSFGKLGVDERTTLEKNLEELCWGSWTGLTSENRDRCCALNNAAMNNLASIKCGEVLN